MKIEQSAELFEVMWITRVGYSRSEAVGMACHLDEMQDCHLGRPKVCLSSLLEHQ